MSFTEIIFAPFLFLTFFLFFLARRYFNLQLLILIIASYIFYGWWNINFLWLIIFSSLLDYFMGQFIYQSQAKSKKRLFLICSLAGNLGLLAYFKYANFFIDSLAMSMELVGWKPPIQALNIVLPVGISFYTFQSLSYSLDIYFDKIKPERSILKFLFFVAAFPQLVAGPIVRAKDFLPQLHGNLFERSDDEGVFYILYGLFKKILIADMLGVYLVDPVFASPGGFSSLELLVGVYAYAFQIFFDFSAYSDIAIGLGRIFGLVLPVNFKSPYSACNPTEFWRRWHITLSTWLRDYLYIPLGGNRVNQIRHVVNLMVVMLLGGLWHGANWTFVFWGGLHGLYLVIHKLIFPDESKWTDKLRFFRMIVFFHLICLTWIFFRSVSIDLAVLYISGLFDLQAGLNYVSWILVVVLLGASVFVHYVCEPRLEATARNFTKLHWIWRTIIIFGFFVALSVLDEKGVSHQAFIYFQF